MKRGSEPFWRPLKRQVVANMEDVLAQLQRSGRIYFVKSLSKTAIQTREDKKKATLSLPKQFAQENGDKIEEWVILRTHKSWGRSSRPWVVRLSATGRSLATRKDQICGGLYAFVAGNQLREGDSLIFVLQEDARSEFEVYVFRGSRRFPLYPDKGDSASSDEENIDNHFSFPSPLHHQDEHKKEFTSKVEEERATPLQNANHWRNHLVVPSFRKQLSASNIGRSDRDPESNSGQFEFPTHFMETYGELVQTSVKLQGIHEDSPTHVIACRRRPGNHLRVDFLVTGWSRFVKENGLEKGHELQFSLMADSYFVVRKV